jgi:hypothetical protein
MYDPIDKLKNKLRDIGVFNTSQFIDMFSHLPQEKDELDKSVTAVTTRAFRYLLDRSSAVNWSDPEAVLEKVFVYGDPHVRAREAKMIKGILNSSR